MWVLGFGLNRDLEVEGTLRNSPVRPPTLVPPPHDGYSSSSYPFPLGYFNVTKHPPSYYGLVVNTSLPVCDWNNLNDTSCQKDCPVQCIQALEGPGEDGECNPECNINACGYDYGDCQSDVFTEPTLKNYTLPLNNTFDVVVDITYPYFKFVNTSFGEDYMVYLAASLGGTLVSHTAIRPAWRYMPGGLDYDFRTTRFAFRYTPGVTSKIVSHQHFNSSTQVASNKASNNNKKLYTLDSYFKEFKDSIKYYRNMSFGKLSQV